MKTTINEIISKDEETIYTCEICGKSSLYGPEIVRCEKDHSCEHKISTYEFSIICSRFQGNDVSYGIAQECSQCGLQLGIKVIDTFDQELLGKIFKILKDSHIDFTKRD
jgi:hypothetical protein